MTTKRKKLTTTPKAKKGQSIDLGLLQETHKLAQRNLKTCRTAYERAVNNLDAAELAAEHASSALREGSRNVLRNS